MPAMCGLTATSTPSVRVVIIAGIVENLIHRLIRNAILEKSIRPDGRKIDEIRP
jgi:polyribonucleotide nucleotidyltransferase